MSKPEEVAQYLSKPEEVGQYLQQEWELFTSQVGEMKDNDTASMMPNVENVAKKSNQQTENIESHCARILDSVPSLKLETFSSSETTPDILQSINAKYSKTSITAETVPEKPVVCGNETNRSRLFPELNELAEFSYSDTYADNSGDLKSSIQIEDQVNDVTDLPGKPLSCLDPAMQNFLSQEGTPTADIEKSTTDIGLSPQAVNSDALQQAMLKQGVSLDPVLFEAVKAQIAQVYPAFAMDPNTLNSIAVQQTMVLQACVASGGNLGTTGAFRTVDSSQLHAAFPQENAQSAEGLLGDQANEITSCVQVQQPKPSSEGASGVTVLSADGSATQKHTSYQKSGLTANPLPFRSGLPTGLTKLSLQSELGKQCELSPEIVAPPGLGDESVPCSSNLALDNKIGGTCSVQTNVGAAVNFPRVDNMLSVPANTQSAFLPSAVTKSYSSLPEKQANLTNVYCASSNPSISDSTSLSSNYSKVSENLLPINMKPLTNPVDASCSTAQPYFHDSTLGQHTLVSSLLSEKVDQNKDNQIPERLETKCSPINHVANRNQSSDLARFVDTQSKYAEKPELTGDSKIESLNLDEIEDDDSEEDEQFELNAKASQEVFNQWQKPLIMKKTIPAPEKSKLDQHVMTKLGSVMTTKHIQMDLGSPKYQMKKDTKGKKNVQQYLFLFSCCI